MTNGPWYILFMHHYCWIWTDRTPTRSLTPPVACCKCLRHTSPIDAGYDASYWNRWILQIQGPVEHFSSHSIVVKRTTLLSKWKLPRPSKCHRSDDTLAQTSKEAGQLRFDFGGGDVTPSGATLIFKRSCRGCCCGELKEISRALQRSI